MEVFLPYKSPGFEEEKPRMIGVWTAVRESSPPVKRCIIELGCVQSSYHPFPQEEKQNS